MSSPSVARVALFACALLTAAQASAWTREESQWNPARLPPTYLINENSAPASIGPAAAVQAINAAMATWAAPTCTRWRSTHAGSTSITRANVRDQTNTFLWISGSWPGELGSVNVTIGVTTPLYNVPGYFIDADIQFNNVGFQWSLDGRRGTVDTQSIALHEQGHYLGLDHSSVRSAVMLATYPNVPRQALDPDDIAGVCALYPSGGAVPDAGMPNNTDPCAQYTSCDGCTPRNGCGWCSTANMCMQGTQTGPGAGACGGGWRWLPQECSGGTTTDSGVNPTDPCSRYSTCETCTPWDGCGWCGATGRCSRSTMSGPIGSTCSSGFAWFMNMCGASMGTDAGAPTGTRSFGEPCRQLQDCQSGLLCVGSSSSTPFCTRVCNDDCSCGRGYACSGRLTNGQTVCFPGTNRCPPPVEDAGTTPPPVDAGNPVFDSGVRPPVDSGTRPPVDTGVMVARDSGTVTTATDTGNSAGDDADNTGGGGGGTGARSGCGCRTPGVPTSPSATGLTIAALALAASRRRRRA